jgi:hypothetical protein
MNDERSTLPPHTALGADRGTIDLEEDLDHPTAVIELADRPQPLPPQGPLAGAEAVDQVSTVGKERLESRAGHLLSTTGSGALRAMADLVKIATDAVTACARRDFASVYDHADNMFTSGFSEFMLAETWNNSVRIAGAFKKIKETRPYRFLLGPLRVVFVMCEFERILVDIQFSFTPEDKILGMMFLAPGLAI